MQDNLYREIILEHWQHPQNYGQLENIDVTSSAKNPLCGDELTVFMQLEQGRIQDIAFTASGCAISIASASIITDYVKDMPITQACALTPNDILTQLELTLTPARQKCALLILQAIEAAKE